VWDVLVLSKRVDCLLPSAGELLDTSQWLERFPVLECMIHLDAVQIRYIFIHFFKWNNDGNEYDTWGL